MVKIKTQQNLETIYQQITEFRNFLIQIKQLTVKIAQESKTIDCITFNNIYGSVEKNLKEINNLTRTREIKA